MPKISFFIHFSGAPKFEANCKCTQRHQGQHMVKNTIIDQDLRAPRHKLHYCTTCNVYKSSSWRRNTNKYTICNFNINFFVSISQFSSLWQVTTKVKVQQKCTFRCYLWLVNIFYLLKTRRFFTIPSMKQAFQWYQTSQKTELLLWKKRGIDCLFLIIFFIILQVILINISK